MAVWNAVSPSLNLLWQAISKVFTFVVNNKPVLIGVLSAIAAAVVTYTAVQVVQFGIQVAKWAATAVAAGISAATQIAAWVAVAAAATAAFVAENIASLGIVTAVVAIAAAAYDLYKHWSEVWGDIKAAALAAWHFIDDDVLHPIEAAFGAVVSFIKQHWQLLAEILLAPVAPALALFLRFHTQIIGFFEDIVKWVQSHFGEISAEAGHVVSAIVGFFTSLPNKVIGFFDDIRHDVARRLEPHERGRPAAHGRRRALVHGPTRAHSYWAGEPAQLAGRARGRGSHPRTGQRHRRFRRPCRQCGQARSQLCMSRVRVRLRYSVVPASHVTAGYGQQIDQGLANGITDNTGLVVNAAAVMSSGLRTTLVDGVSAAYAAAAVSAQAGNVTLAGIIESGKKGSQGLATAPAAPANPFADIPAALHVKLAAMGDAAITKIGNATAAAPIGGGSSSGGGVGGGGVGGDGGSSAGKVVQTAARRRPRRPRPRRLWLPRSPGRRRSRTPARMRRVAPGRLAR